MTLVDTSVWIDHFRRNNELLRDLIERENVSTHPFVVGELACGPLADRSAILANLAKLPSARIATHREVLALVENRALWNKGIGWIDAHLLASAMVCGYRLWTLDRALEKIAVALTISYT